MMKDYELDILAVSETWMNDDASNAVKFDLAAPGFGILHVHGSRATGGPSRGGGLTVIYSSKLSVRARKKIMKPISLELQVVNVKSGSNHNVIVNIYYPPSSSKPAFLAELADFITTTGIEVGDQLVLCGDFNLPGLSSATIDQDLENILETHGLQ